MSARRVGKSWPQHPCLFRQPVVNVLADTGASCTCIDHGHLSQLGIAPSGLINVHTSTTAGKPVQCQQFDVDIAVILDNGNSHHLGTFPVLESSLISQGIDGLLGRDVLSRGILFYNGGAGTLTLAF